MVVVELVRLVGRRRADGVLQLPQRVALVLLGISRRTPRRPKRILRVLLRLLRLLQLLPGVDSSDLRVVAGALGDDPRRKPEQLAVEVFERLRVLDADAGAARRAAGTVDGADDGETRAVGSPTEEEGREGQQHQTGFVAEGKLEEAEVEEEDQGDSFEHQRKARTQHFCWGAEGLKVI